MRYGEITKFLSAKDVRLKYILFLTERLVQCEKDEHKKNHHLGFIV